MKKALYLGLLFTGFLCGTSAAQSTTLVAEKDGKLVRPLPLERLSYGPDDSYQVSPGDGRELYFSLKTHMSPRIAVLDLDTLKSRALGDALRDADQATLSPDGRRLAFRSLARSPEGEICIYSFTSRSTDCPNLQSGEKTSPVWTGNDGLVFLRKDNLTGESRLESLSLANQHLVELSRGRIFHPSFAPESRLLAWVERESRQALRQKIVVGPFAGSKIAQTCPLNLTWPGLSAFPRIASDGKTLIFSHYLTDSNQDGRIDAEDVSMIASLKLPPEIAAGKGCTAQAITPEPLTSLSDNCSQPALHDGRIYMSCASDGSLDLYRVPLTGVIPPNWDEKTLVSAHAAARSPEERLLYLLSLNGRFPNRFPGLALGIFAQHLLMNDEAGARPFLPVANQPLWDLALRAGEIRKTEPPGEISLSLRQRLEALSKSASKLPASFLRSVVLARIQSLSGRSSAAGLKEASSRKPESALDFMIFSLAWEKLSTSNRNEDLYISVLKKTPFASPASALTYWAKTLERLEDQYPLAGGKIPAPRLRHIQNWRAGASGDAQLLLDLELKAFDVALEAKDAYLAFDKLFSDSRGKSEVVRLAGYRAIRMWTRADRLKEVEFITSNLLKFVEGPSLEWTYARDYFIATSFDRAYEQRREARPAAALGHFYGAATLTDDLEAHWGYITSMIAAGRGGQLERQIDELKRRNFIDQNEPFVRDLIILGRAGEGLPANPEGWLENAKSDLKSEDPLGNFLLGSVRLQWLMNQKNLGADKRSSELERARLELVYALDGARNNERLRLAVLTQLGLLSSWSKEWGAANRYWQQRLRSAFEKPEEAEIVRYLRAQALFGLQDFESAHGLLATGPVPSKGPLAEPVWHLRIQVAAMADRHDEVLRLMPKGEVPVGSLTESRRALLFARSMIKTAKPVPACALLSRIDQSLEARKSTPLPDSPRGDHPERLRILALGYQSQCAAGTPEALAVLKRFGEALAIDEDQQKALGFSALNFLELKMKSRARLWAAGGAMEAGEVHAYLQDLEKHRTEAGAFVQLGQFEAMQALGGLILLKKPQLPAEDVSTLTERIGSFLQSAKNATTVSDLVKSQEIRLRSLKDRLEPGGATKVGGVTITNSEILSELTRLKLKNQYLGRVAENYVNWINAL